MMVYCRPQASLPNPLRRFFLPNGISLPNSAHKLVQILWDVTVDTGYVQPMNFLAPGSRGMFDANNKAVDYLFHALCQPEFDRLHT
jgi:hypothetical protein